MIKKSITCSISKESIDSYGMKRWDKAGVIIELEDGDTVEGALSEAKADLHNYHKGLTEELSKGLFAQYNPPNVNSTVPYMNQSVAEVDEEFEIVKRNLDGIEYKEDAEEYLNTTDYKLAYEAKQIVNKKPSKQ